ncbi:hypothetical protein DFQ28_010287 [Apophysomyces sp. BC1034]|nr:hypothetical protein DFQ30_001216 [Apophysomyces sp. BC1015]KAG0184883.1 hypothetical protein DFQ28_010287 [Apophysomyces sp. BC1034]
MRRVGRLAEQTAAERDAPPDRLERIGGQLLRHQPDARARGAIVGDDVVAVDAHTSRARIDDPTDDADQRRLARAVRPQQRKNLAALDVQVDLVQRPEAGRIRL